MTNSPAPSTQESPTSIIAHALEQGTFCASEGIAPAELMQWDEDKLEALYALGRDFYMRGDYHAAEQVMNWLARVKGADGRILKALGAARKMQGKYEDAVNAYSLAAIADLEDPEPSFFAAECLFHLGEAKRTRAALAAAHRQAEAKPDSSLCARIEAMQAMLEDK